MQSEILANLEANMDYHIGGFLSELWWDVRLYGSRTWKFSGSPADLSNLGFLVLNAQGLSLSWDNYAPV